MNPPTFNSDQPKRLKVFVSSSMSELFDDRKIIDQALKDIGLEAWTFEDDAGARVGSIQDTYITEVERCDLFIAVFWKKFGERSIEEFKHAQNLSKDILVFEKRDHVEQERDPRLQNFLNKIGEVETGITPRWYFGHKELSTFIKDDVNRWQSEVIRRQLSMGPGAGRLWSKHVPIIIPAKNESENIIYTIKTMLDGPGGSTAEIIIVDDNSSDDTIEKAKSISILNPNQVIVLENSHTNLRKVGAYLTGLEFLAQQEPSHEFVALLDADTILQKVDLPKNNDHNSTLEDWDFDACAFRILPKKSPSISIDLTAYEYTIGTDSLRNLLHAVTCISGAGSVWRQKKIMALLKEHSGIFQGDDLETTLLANDKFNLNVIYDPSIVAVTSRPNSLFSYLNQRLRWDIGLIRNVIRPRFWRNVLFKRSLAAASYRAIFIADVILHPLKIIAFTAPFILYLDRKLQLPPPIWSLEKQMPYLNSPLLVFVGIILGFALINGLIVKGNIKKRLSISGFGILYLLAPFITLIFLFVTAPNQQTGIVSDDKYLRLSYDGEVKVFFRTIVIPFALSLLCWWVPLTHLILQKSSDPAKRRIGFHTLLLPFLQLWNLLIIRTISVILAPFSRIKNYQNLGKWAVGLSIIATLSLPILPTMIITNHSKVASTDFQTSEEWLINSLIEYKGNLYAQSYPDYRKSDFWIYDSSLAIIALTEHQNWESASGLLKGLNQLQNNDGSVHTAYDWVEDMEKAYPLDNRIEIAPNAWLLLASLRYEVASKDSIFQPMIKSNINWLRTRLFTHSDNRVELRNDVIVDTREIAITYAALRYANNYLDLKIEDEVTILEKYLMETVWDKDRAIFLERPEDDTPGSVVSQTLATMALAETNFSKQQLSKTLKWIELSRETTVSIPLEVGSIDVTGLFYTGDYPNTVYGEGFFQLATAYGGIDDNTLSDSWKERGERLLTRQGGIFYAIGPDYLEFAGRPALAPTAWYLICKKKINPLGAN